MLKLLFLFNSILKKGINNAFIHPVEWVYFYWKEFKSGAIARISVFESEVFFNQDILRWSINDICFTQPKESVTKWLRLKNIFSSSNQERLQEKMFLSQKCFSIKTF